MADDQLEHGELTDRFRAFSQSVDPEPSRVLPVALIAAAAVILVVFGIVVWILVANP